MDETKSFALAVDGMMDSLTEKLHTVIDELIIKLYDCFTLSERQEIDACNTNIKKVEKFFSTMKTKNVTVYGRCLNAIEDLKHPEIAQNLREKWENAQKRDSVVAKVSSVRDDHKRSSHGIRGRGRINSLPSIWNNDVTKDISHSNRSNYSKQHQWSDIRRHSAQSSGCVSHSRSIASRYGYGYANYVYPIYPGAAHGPRDHPSPAEYPQMYSPYCYKRLLGTVKHSKPLPDLSLHGVSSHHQAPRKASKIKGKSSFNKHATCNIRGEQVIGYGPDIIDDEGSINKHQDDGSDVHSPPPPSIKDEEIKEDITTKDQNFIMIERNNLSCPTVLHPSGLQLNFVKQPFVYDGRYDSYIEPDEEWVDADSRYGITVLAVSAATLGISIATSVAFLMNNSGLITPTSTTKGITTVTKQGDISMAARFNIAGKTEYNSATLSHKRKKRTITWNDFRSVENFAKMPPQYGESTDDIHLRGGLGACLMRRNASMIELGHSVVSPAYSSELPYDSEQSDDSEELKGVEIIVHQDTKITNSKESLNKQEETATTDVTGAKVTENTEVQKKMRKEKCKRRIEKRYLAGLQLSLPTPKQPIVFVEIDINQQVTVDVHNKKLKQISSGEDSGIIQAKGDISKVGNFSSVSKPEYCSATLPCKRKTVMKKDCHSVENFTKMPLQYRKSIDDTHMNQIGGGLGESLKSRDASMVELACSGNKDTEKACDSKELEIVEIIVHQDVKNTENQKESYNSQEKTVTIDVSIKVAQNSDVHKEKKKERSKRRSEKRTLVGLPMPKQQPSLLPTEVKNNALNNITANVYHTKLKQTSPMVEASDSQESFVEQNSSMQALPDTQVKARPSQSSKNLLQMQDSAQVTSENVITSDSNDSQSIIPLSADTGSSPVPDICTSKDFNEEDFKTYTNTLKDECLVNNENTVRVVAEQILKWEPLGRVLGLSEPKIIVIQINNQHDYEEQKYQCIMKWISERGQATTLITLLRKIYFELEDKSLVMKITQKLQQKPPTMQPSPTKAQKIYISYCEEDTTIDFIKRLKSDLMKFRYEVFWDERNINNGNSATEKLAEAISSCDVIIVVMTKKYFESEWCGKGFTFPDAQKKKLIFIKWEEFDDSEIAGSTLKNQLWLNFIKDEEYDDSFEILAKELAQCKKAESAEAISAKRKSCMVM